MPSLSPSSIEGEGEKGGIPLSSLINCYVEIMTTAAPYALAFWVGDMIVTTLMSAITGGYLKVGRSR